jgi:hypothetical protein
LIRQYHNRCVNKHLQRGRGVRPLRRAAGVGLWLAGGQIHALATLIAGTAFIAMGYA